MFSRSGDDSYSNGTTSSSNSNAKVTVGSTRFSSGSSTANSDSTSQRERYRPSTSGFGSSSSRYSSRIIGSGGIFVSSRSRFALNYGNWHTLPEDVLLSILQQLRFKDLISASQVCKHWNAVAFSDYLWKRYFQRNFHQDASIPLSPRAQGGWRGEFARLVHRAPIMHCQTLRDHRTYVLHVAFANAGDLFATCSFDARVIVWTAEHPCRPVHQADLQRKFNWMFASYSQFNSSDTLLMVSGAYFGTGPFLTAGEVVIFDLEEDFRLLSRTKNRPYDLFGAWITDDYLVTGELKWLQNMHSTSTLLLIRSTQETGSEHVPILSTLLRLFNTNSACARCLMVAHCPPTGGPPPEKQLLIATREAPDAASTGKLIDYTEEYYVAAHEAYCGNEDEQEAAEEGEGGRPLTPPQSLDDTDERLLIFTTGDKTFTPHQIGIIRLRPSMPDRVEVHHDIAELIRRKEDIKRRVRDHPGVNVGDYDAVKQLCREPDHIIEMAGNVVGMALSPDHRFLYVNSHRWLGSNPAANPVTAPPIATNVDIHVFDLATLKQVGCMVQNGQTCVSSDESYYIFPSVSHHYVASGGNKGASLWDRHYGVCVAELPHDDSVSCAAINPRCPEMMVTVSDDKTIKVWRSRRAVHEHHIARGVEATILLPAPATLRKPSTAS